MPDVHIHDVPDDVLTALESRAARLGLSRNEYLPNRGAATAELAGLTVLHVDKDFELIAEITEQSIERLRLL